MSSRCHGTYARSKTMYWCKLWRARFDHVPKHAKSSFGLSNFSVLSHHQNAYRYSTRRLSRLAASSAITKLSSSYAIFPAGLRGEVEDSLVKLNVQERSLTVLPNLLQVRQSYCLPCLILQAIWLTLRMMA